MRPGYDPHTVLQRVLLLERQQGFQDRAAVGGLAHFAEQQIDRADGNKRHVLTQVARALDGYGQSDRRSREAAVASALGALLGSPITPPGATPDAQRAPTNGRDSTAERPQATNGAPPPKRVPTMVRSRPKLSIVHRPEELDQPVSALKGIRKPTVDALDRIGVRSIRDLLYYFPRTHYDYTDTSSISRMRLGQKTTLVGRITSVRNNKTPRGAMITTVVISDESGTVAARWFNQPYVTRYLEIGKRVAVSGEPETFNGFIYFQPKDYEIIEDADLTHTARLVPIYPLTKGLFQRSLRGLIKRTVDEYATAVEDYLPHDLPRELKLPSLQHAIEQYHFPDEEEEKEWAQQRLAFDELLLIQLGLLQRKQEWQQNFPDVAVELDTDLDRRFRESLPFQLTGAQEEVIAEIYRDMRRPAPMSRLLQGDVGSGKTVVAASALLQIVQAGKQGVLMAPTEILAEQHARTLEQLLSPFGITVELLLGSTPKARRKKVYAMAASGMAQVLVGTHALIQEGVAFARLGLAITDEQHRFGVEQRATLRSKGMNPHILAMTATPIPRTLAMTIYGDLDVSAIDEMPPGRLPVVTTWSRTPAEAYGVVRDEVRKGRQAFVICPVIEESAESDMRSVMAEHRELSNLTFADLQVGLLHGRMKPKEKEAMLEAFRRGDYHILVATSVVEVGIDIPNATVMVIRDAHRFGLAQLHQFRGRVGRGGDQAFCVLLSDSEGDEARERLDALTATDNGFDLAEEDLRLRGPGEFWGTRQSGLPELRVAQLGDLPTIQLAREAAQEILASDPDLSAPDHEALRERVRTFWSETVDLS